MRFRVAAATAAVAATALVIGCSSPSAPHPGSGSAASGGTIPLLTIGTSFSIPTLNPLNDTTLASIIDDLSLETLFNLGPNYELEPNLATSMTQPNPVTYVYHLRQGVKFWDGTPLTSADVVYCWDQYRAPSSPDTSDFVDVKDIEAAGPYTVVVTLTQPNAAWRYVPADLPGVFEMKFFEAHKATFGNAGTLIMGTGPWEVDSFDPTKGAELSANPHWWGGKVPIQRISVTLFSNETSEELAMRAGEIDLVPYILDTKSFIKTSGANLLSAPSFLTANFAMNTQVAPWNNVYVRRAVAYALNRPDIIGASGGSNSPVYTIIPPSTLREIASQSQVNSLLGSLPQYKFNLAAAKAEMAKSPYPHGFSTTLFEYNYGPSLPISEAIATELQRIGINAHITVTSSLSAWYAELGDGPASAHPAEFSTGWCSSSPDISACPAMAFGSLKTGQGLDLAYWAPSAVGNLMNAGLATNDSASRLAAYSKLLQMSQAAVPYVALYQEGIGTALSSKFAAPGFAANPNSFAVFNGSGAYALNVRLAS
jgi:peptide/nickel transport system substrate-binding protein